MLVSRRLISAVISHSVNLCTQVWAGNEINDGTMKCTN